MLFRSLMVSTRVSGGFGRDKIGGVGVTISVSRYACNGRPPIASEIIEIPRHKAGIPREFSSVT